MNFGLTFLRTDAKNVHIIFRKPQTRSPISAWTLFHTSRKWVETMFRTWYSASQIYTTIVIIFASSGMDLYFVPRWLEKAGKISRTDWAGVGILVVWYPKGWNHEVSAGWLGNRKRPSFRNHLLERCLVEIWLWTMGSDEVMILPYQLYSVLMTFVRKGRPISTAQKSTCSPPWDRYCPIKTPMRELKATKV